MKKRTNRQVVHTQRRKRGRYDVVMRGENVTLVVTRHGAENAVKTRTGQGKAGVRRAIWEGEHALAVGRDRVLLEWN